MTAYHRVTSPNLRPYKTPEVAPSSLVRCRLRMSNPRVNSPGDNALWLAARAVGGVVFEASTAITPPPGRSNGMIAAEFFGPDCSAYDVSAFTRKRDT
jgi:hypothetical protein